MSSLPQKVKAVMRVYERLDKDIAAFQKRTTLHCLSGCGECCKKPDIEAGIVEFLPLALDLYDRGLAEATLEELQKKPDSICHVFRPHITSFGGLCNAYPHRGLICRLFGFTARINKEEQKELVTCKHIKEEQHLAYQKAMDGIAKGEKVPVMSEYYYRMQSIDPGLQGFYPINVAMSKAIETVLHYYTYRKRRKPSSKSQV
jgi:Fe-S-cluster containining protein